MDEKKIKFNWKYFLWIALAVFLLRLPTFYQHIIDIDETVFSEFAKVFLSGGLPYVDVVDNKPPLTYFFFAVVYFLTGSHSLLAVHVITGFWVLFTALVIFFIGKSLASTKASFAGTMVFILLMHTYEPKYVSTNGETLINLFLVVSVYIFLFYDLKLKTLILHIISGIMLGLSVLTNYKAGVLPIAYIIYTFVVVPFFSFDKGKSFKGTAAKLVITGVASFVPVIAVAIYFYYKGNLQEALFWGFAYNFGYIESGSSSGSVLKIFGRSLYFIILGLPAWIAIVKGICSKIKNFKECVSYEKFQILIFLLLWILISFYAATLGGRGYGHYFIQIVPPLSLLVAFFYDDIYYKKVFWAWNLIPVFIFTLSRIDIIRTYEIINYPNYKSG
jgi:4-amino-4-deoxy-L-arabinose transferase-like glycosyltransferase